jgi:hypothetical protein
MKVDDEIMLPPTQRFRGDTVLHTLAGGTDSQIMTVFSSDTESLNSAVNSLVGELRGSLGWGMATYTYDFGQVVSVKEISVLYTLYDNTNGLWRVTFSEDGYVYTPFTRKYGANEISQFANKRARYIKFELEIFSALSASKEVPGENVPLPVISPSISGITFVYTVPEERYLYVNRLATSSVPSKAVVSVTSSDTGFVYLGVSTANSHNWHDFDSPAKPSILDGGKFVIPMRTGYLGNQVVEPLVSIDGLLYKTVYGPWDYSSTVNIIGSSGVMAPDKYVLYPRDGTVIFKAKQHENMTIQITDLPHVRIGAKITSTDEYGYLRGMSIFYK